MVFFKIWAKEAILATVKPGSRFCRRRSDQVTETATVLELRSDRFGIPHVHFTLAFERTAHGAVYEGQRVLALRTFVHSYPVRIA
jgi:hypothetical protein